MPRSIPAVSRRGQMYVNKMPVIRHLPCPDRDPVSQKSLMPLRLASADIIAQRYYEHECWRRRMHAGQRDTYTL